MANTSPPKWETLKDEGNALFAQGSNAASFAKYSEAIALAPENAVLYSNRAAALMKMGRLDAAQNDATRATELDPKWVKGHIRHAQVLVAQDRLEDAIFTYHQAITLGDDDKQRKNYESQRDQVKKKIERSQWQRRTTVSKEEAANFFMKRIEADIPDPSTFKFLCPSPLGYLTAADKIYDAYVEWKEGLEVLSKLQVDGMYIRTAGRVSEPLVSALVGDERCFVIENIAETHKNLQLQISAEQQQWGAIGPGMPVKDIITHYKKMLAKDGWDKVRPSVSTTIRVTFLIGAMELMLGLHGDGSHKMRRAIAIAEAVNREFPLSSALDHATRGNTLRPTFIRGLNLILGHALIIAMNNAKRKSFSIEDFKTIGEKVLASLAENPILLPPKTMPPLCNAVQLNLFRFSNVFGTYHYAGAYMLYYPPWAKGVTDSRLGYYWKRKAIDDGTDHGAAGMERNRECLQESTTFYLKAAALFPDDEREKQIAFWALIENVMHLGGATVGAIRDMVTLAVRLEEFTKKYDLGTVESKERKDITDMLERVEKINGSDARHIKLKPARDLSIEGGESEEEIAERMMRLDVRDDDGDDKDWIKLYMTYVKRKDEGNLDETPLQVS